MENNIHMNVAVMSRSFSRHPVLRARLLDIFPSVKFNDEGLSLAGPSIVDFLAGFECAIVALEKMNAEVLSQLPQLQVIGKYGVGIDNIDLQACVDHNIKVGWRSGVNRRSVAEMAISLMIASQRKLHQSHLEIINGTFRQVSGPQLSQSTVGLVGCGHIGKEIIKLLAPFGSKIIINDIQDCSDFCAEWNVEQVSFEELIERADVVSLHVPNTPLTENMINKEVLGKMKATSVLINTARGGLVDEGALKVALGSGEIFGAALDVFKPEPPLDKDMIDLPNLICTSHLGGSSNEAILAMGHAAIDGLMDPEIATDHIPAYMKKSG